MLSPTWIVRSGGFAPRLALYYATYFVGVGVQVPFFPVWLADKGLEPRTIGAVLALPMFVRLLAIPIMSRLADRHDALRIAIVVGTIATAIGYALTGLMTSAAGILIVYGVFALVYTPTMPLVDTYALRGLAQYGGAYGPLRLWGSATFILGSLGAGLLLDSIMPGNLIWLITGGYALTAIVSFGLAPLATTPSQAAPRPAARALLRDPTFVAAICGASLVQASHALLNGFATISWQAQGIEPAGIGALSALGVIAEILMFALSARLPDRIGPTTMLMIGAAGAALRWGAMTFEPPALMLPLLQCLHAFSFAATQLGALTFIARAAPPGFAARAQGHYAVVTGLTTAAAMGGSGLLYGAYGQRGYAAMAAIAVAGGLLSVYAHRHRRAPGSAAA